MDTSADAPAAPAAAAAAPVAAAVQEASESVSQAEAMDTNPDQRGTTDGKEHPAGPGPSGAEGGARGGGAAVLGSFSVAATARRCVGLISGTPHLRRGREKEPTSRRGRGRLANRGGLRGGASRQLAVVRH